MAGASWVTGEREKRITFGGRMLVVCRKELTAAYIYVIRQINKACFATEDRTKVELTLWRNDPRSHCDNSGMFF